MTAEGLTLIELWPQHHANSSDVQQLVTDMVKCAKIILDQKKAGAINQSDANNLYGFVNKVIRLVNNLENINKNSPLYPFQDIENIIMGWCSDFCGLLINDCHKPMAVFVAQTIEILAASLQFSSLPCPSALSL